MLSIFKKALVASVVIAGLASLSQAAVVTYTLSLNDNGKGVVTPGSYAIYASDSAGDNFGLASILVDISGETTVTNRLPSATYSDSNGDINGGNGIPSGFTFARSGISVTDFIGGGVDSSVTMTYFVMGFGQTGGNLGVIPPTLDTKSSVQPAASFAGTSGVYWAPLVVATGTFTDAPVWGGGSTASIYTQDVSGIVTNGAGATPSQQDATVVVRTVDLVPEPASLGVLALGGLALLARRRKTA